MNQLPVQRASELSIDSASLTQWLVQGLWSDQAVGILGGEPKVPWLVRVVRPDPSDARSIQQKLEFVPEKVLFGTDAYPYSPQQGWQETAVASARAGRGALKIALSAMMRDGEINEDRALELARMVLRDNARKLYHLK